MQNINETWIWIIRRKNFTMKYSYELTYRKSYLVSHNDFV